MSKIRNEVNIYIADNASLLLQILRLMIFFYFFRKVCKKSWFSKREILVSNPVSMFSFWNKRYTLERSQESLRANHEMLRSWRSSSSFIKIPIDFIVKKICHRNSPNQAININMNIHEKRGSLRCNHPISRLLALPGKRINNANSPRLYDIMVCQEIGIPITYIQSGRLLRTFLFHKFCENLLIEEYV